MVRAWRVLFVAVLALGVTGFLSVAAVRHGFFDLQVYYGALHYWRDGGELYDYTRPGTAYGFTYPPFAALLMAPMAYLGWHTTIALSVIASVLASAVVLWWLVDPIARREGWSRWFTLAVTLCLAAAYEPMRETVLFGQVNMLLVLLVAGDLLWLVTRDSPYAGIALGLATAVKLTPGIFIGYLLVTRRWRAAGLAGATAVAATLLAADVAPHASREFWTVALWDTDRVGRLGFISNQSLRGLVGRLGLGQAETAVWLVLVAVTLAVWLWRLRGADLAGGLALTGVAGCLVSPVTWVHHLVWLIPALVLVVAEAVASPAGGWRRRGLLGFAIVGYALLCSRLVWRWEWGWSGLSGFLGSNAYVWAGIALLFVTPTRLADAGRFGRTLPDHQATPLSEVSVNVHRDGRT